MQDNNNNNNLKNLNLHTPTSGNIDVELSVSNNYSSSINNKEIEIIPESYEDCIAALQEARAYLRTHIR